ncbi:MAG: T9SS type A sorting domain-containing protein [Bacteroidota bacterium]
MLATFSSRLSAQDSPLNVAVFASPLACFGDSDGQLIFSIEGGVPPFQYEWSTLNNPFVFAQGEILFPAEQLTVGGSLSADDYLLNIVDGEGQTIQDTFQLENPPLIQIAAIDVGNSTCGTNCDGFIAMGLTGGTGLLTTSWTDTEFTSSNREGLCAGEYVFIISDENGCTQKGILPIEGPAPLTLESAIDAPSCLGADNGAIEVTASGGAGEYSYSWSSGQQAASLSGLAAGTYQVSLTDANGCSTSEEYIILEGPQLASNLQINYGCGDGNVIVSTQPINGNSPYNFQWSTGAQSSILYGMNEGAYSLVLQDANGCTSSEDFIVDYVTPLSVETTVTDVSCFSAADGQINLSVIGGLAPINISWDNGMNGNQISGLNGGEYLFNLNASGCGYAELVNVAEPGELMAEVYFTPEENNTLSGTALLSGGTGPYILEWSTGSSNITVHNLLPEETYFLRVTDARQCTQTFEIIARLTNTDDLSAEERLVIAPNPCHDVLHLKFAETWRAPILYQLYDYNGSRLQDGQFDGDNSLDLTSYPRGAYYLRLWVGEENLLRKVIKL